MGNWKWLSLIEVMMILSYLDYSFNNMCNLVFLGIFMRLSKLCSYSIISTIGKSQLCFQVTSWTLLLSLVTVCNISRSSLLEPPKDVLLNRGSETRMAMVKLPTLSHRMAYICGLLEDLNMFTRRDFLSFRARHNGKQKRDCMFWNVYLINETKKVHVFFLYILDKISCQYNTNLRIVFNTLSPSHHGRLI